MLGKVVNSKYNRFMGTYNAKVEYPYGITVFGNYCPSTGDHYIVIEKNGKRLMAYPYSWEEEQNNPTAPCRYWEDIEVRKLLHGLHDFRDSKLRYLYNIAYSKYLGARNNGVHLDRLNLYHSQMERIQKMLGYELEDWA